MKSFAAAFSILCVYFAPAPAAQAQTNRCACIHSGSTTTPAIFYNSHPHVPPVIAAEIFVFDFRFFSASENDFDSIFKASTRELSIPSGLSPPLSLV